MNCLKNLFGKNPKSQEPDMPEYQPEPGVLSEAEAHHQPHSKPAPAFAPDSSVSESKSLRQTTPWRTFSIFISSTFADMQAERSYLKAIVFPKVEEELRKKRISLEIVDLRWGVDTASVKEEEREATVLQVVLEEIRRCKPFFIGLLGDRYGWVPPEERMKIATIGEKLILPAKGKSVTALEIEFGVLASAEQLNRSVFYLRDRLPYDDFTPEKAASYCDEFDPDLTPTVKKERKTSLETLKVSIRKHFEAKQQPGKVKTYQAQWDKDLRRVKGLESWGEQVVKDILQECAKHAEDTWDQVPQNQPEQELALLDAFIESHTHITTINIDKGEEQVATFCGRKKLLDELTLHLLSDQGNSGLVLTGASGSGKSAVFSMAYKMMQQEGCFVLAHSAGISTETKSVAGLLRSWNWQLSVFLQLKEEDETLQSPGDTVGLLLREPDQKETKTGIEKLQERFAELIYLTAGKTKVVLLIDALDCFEPTDRAAYMTWMPAVLPSNVRILVTAITGTEKKACSFHKNILSRSIDHFTTEEAAGMLKSLCRKQHKDISLKVEKIILGIKREDGLPAASSPLWLSLAVSILMAMDAADFEKISGSKNSGGIQIVAYMQEIAEKFPALPGDLFLNLVGKSALIFGILFTPAVFNFIACSRDGLRETDLESLIKNTNNVEWDLLNFANLRRWFHAHLVEQGEGHQWNLAHSILRNTLNEKMEPEDLKNLHTSLATHLLSLPAADALRVSETMYHLMQMEDKKPAIVYYTSELDDEALAGATKVLAETVTLDSSGLEMVAALPVLVGNNKDIFPVLLKRLIYNLYNFLEVEGNLNQRLTLLNKLTGVLEKNYGDSLPTWNFGYDKAVLSMSIGFIQQTIGQINDAINSFEKSNKIFNELHESYPHNESVKNGLAFSIRRLGSINEVQGKFAKALSYYKDYENLAQKLFTENPNSETNKYNLAGCFCVLGDIYKSMGHVEKATNYFELYNKFCKELNNTNLHNTSYKIDLANSYSRLGVINEVQGKFEEALLNYRKDNNIIQELYDDNPKSEKIKYGLVFSYDALGGIHNMMGHLEEALSYFDDEARLLKELNESNPLNELQKNGLAISYSRIGSIYKSMGHFEEALSYFEKRLILGKEVYESNPLNEWLKNGLAVSYSDLGDIHQEMGHMEEALKYFEQCYKLNTELIEFNPNSELTKENLAFSYSRLGYIHQEMGHVEEALNYFEKRLALGKEHYDSNPQNEWFINGLAFSYEKLGSIHQAMGHVEEALNYFEKRSALGKELYDANPLNESMKSGLAKSYLRLGDIHLELGRIEEALNYFELCYKLNAELFESNPQNEAHENDLAISYERLGVIHQKMGHMDEALNYFETGIKLTEGLSESNPRDEYYKKNLEVQYSKLSKIHQAMGNFEKALNYLLLDIKFTEDLSKTNPSNESLNHDLALSIGNLGSIHRAMGHMDESLISFVHCNKIMKTLYEANPQNELLKNDFALSWSRLGEIHQTIGNFEEALNFFKNYNFIAYELFESNQGNAKLAFSLATSWICLGWINEQLNKPSDAAQEYLKAFPVLENCCKESNIPDYLNQFEWLKNSIKKVGQISLIFEDKTTKINYIYKEKKE